MQSSDIRCTGVSLLFPAGSRPTQDDLSRLFESSDTTGLMANISHCPKEDDWLEVLASGLTFDITGLAPAPAPELAETVHVYGFDQGAVPQGLEPIVLMPSGHIIAGAGLEPVLRIMAGLAANLVLHLPVAGVAWHSARSVMEPRYFSRIALNWLSGGAFPALGLTALTVGADGSVASSGLASFTGQELQLEGAEGEAPADTIKLAIRLVDYFVRHGRLEEPERIDAGGVALLAEPSRGGPIVLIWRET